MLAAFLWRDVLLYLVREEYHPNLVIVLYGAERQRGGNLRGHVTFHLPRRTEVKRPRDVYEQHYRQLTLFLEDLHVGTVEAGSDIPVYISHVIAKLVFPNLRERHSPTLEG